MERAGVQPRSAAAAGVGSAGAEASPEGQGAAGTAGGCLSCVRGGTCGKRGVIRSMPEQPPGEVGRRGRVC